MNEDVLAQCYEQYDFKYQVQSESSWNSESFQDTIAYTKSMTFEADSIFQKEMKGTFVVVMKKDGQIVDVYAIDQKGQLFGKRK